MEAVQDPSRPAFQHPDPLQEAEAQLQQFVETIPTVAWCASPSGEFKLFTKYFQEYTGLTPEEYLGWGWTSAIHPDDLPALLSAWAAIRAAGEPSNLDCRVRRHDGEYRFVAARVVPFRDKHGRIHGWYGCSEDIEEHKRTEQRQLSGAEELCNVIDAIAELIAVVNPDGKLTYVNDEFRRYAGIPAGQYEYDRIREAVFHPEELEAMRVERLNGFEKRTRFVTEHRVRRHDGQFRWHQIRYSPLKNATHQIIRWYATGIDNHEQHIAAARLENENFALREEITRSLMFEEIVGSSEPMERVLASVIKVAPSDSTVLITGETGTGKELIARAIHNHSPRKSKAFIRVNCAAIPASLVASELFGHEKGAFTGALQRRLGRFEAADGGTLFLDEIGDLPPETQVSLLRVLQEHEFERIGSNTPISVDVRVVVATNVDLPARVAAGTFRRDLFYRLNVFPIPLPSLRDRVDDISLLVEYFIGRYARKAGKRIARVSKQTLELCRSYSWPGNIRELQNVIERSVILCEGDLLSIDAAWLANAVAAPAPLHQPLEAELAGREKELIEKALAASNGRIAGPSGAATKLKVPRQTLTSKMKALGIKRTAPVE